MTKEKNSMDNFLRDSLGNMEIEPSRNVWKGLSKRLIIFELLRLNFTNVGKTWVYSGLAVMATFVGLSYFSLQEDASIADDHTPLSKTEQVHGLENESRKNNETPIIQPSENAAQTMTSETISESETLVSNPTASEIISEPELDMPRPTAQYNPTDDHLRSSTSMASMSHEEQRLAIPSFVDMKTTELYIIDEAVIWPSMASYQPLNKEFEEDVKKNASTKGKLEWFVSANYMPEWPISDNDIYVNNQQLSLIAGFQHKKLSFSMGLGLKTEKTPSKFRSHYSSFDSVGYFYDIDYFEEHPIIEDSIIIHYTIQNIYDSVSHQSEMNGPDQRRRWVFIPVEIGYQLLSKPKYELTGKLAATFGWEVYSESPNVSNAFPANYSIEDITPQTQSYVQIGIGLENSFSILPQWWIYAEPRINYYTKSPYRFEGSSQSGPFGFGLQLGVKYKLKGRR